MRINKENIDYNALREIWELVSDLYDYTGEEEDFENMRIATLGEIRGICRFADMMKEVLKA